MLAELVRRSAALTPTTWNPETRTVDAVISTVPTPFVSKLVPSLPAEARAKYDAIRNIGVVCVLLKLGKPVTKQNGKTAFRFSMSEATLQAAA